MWTESGDQDRGTFGLAASSQRRSEVWWVLFFGLSLSLGLFLLQELANLFFGLSLSLGSLFIVGAGQGQESDDGAASISCFSL